MCPERSSASSRSRLSWRREDQSGSIGVPLLLPGRRPLRRMPQPGGFGETDPIPQLQGHCRANRSRKSRSSSEPQEQRTPQRAASLWARKGPEPAWAQTAAREEPRLRRTGREQLGAGVGDPREHRCPGVLAGARAQGRLPSGRQGHGQAPRERSRRRPSGRGQGQALPTPRNQTGKQREARSGLSHWSKAAWEKAFPDPTQAGTGCRPPRAPASAQAVVRRG